MECEKNQKITRSNKIKHVQKKNRKPSKLTSRAFIAEFEGMIIHIFISKYVVLFFYTKKLLKSA